MSSVVSAYIRNYFWRKDELSSQKACLIVSNSSPSINNINQLLMACALYTFWGRLPYFFFFIVFYFPPTYTQNEIFVSSRVFQSISKLKHIEDICLSVQRLLRKRSHKKACLLRVKGWTNVTMHVPDSSFEIFYADSQFPACSKMMRAFASARDEENCRKHM